MKTCLRMHRMHERKTKQPVSLFLMPLVLGLVLWVCLGEARAAFSETDPMTFKQKALNQKRLLETTLLEYNHLKEELESDTFRLASQREWAGHVIARYKDLDHEVPESTQTHYEKLLKHIEAKKREVSRLESMMTDRIRQLEALDAEVKNAFKTEVLDWWIFRSEVNTLMARTDISSSSGRNQKNALFDDLEKKIRQNDIGDWVVLSRGPDGPVMNVDLPILFSSGKITISDKYRTFLKKLAGVVKTYDIQVNVEGFADHTPLKNKKYASNWELAARRALNVAQVLISQGVEPAACRIISHGENGQLSKAANRRVELSVVFK